jgi:hypothetical protein
VSYYDTRIRGTVASEGLFATLPASLCLRVVVFNPICVSIGRIEVNSPPSPVGDSGEDTAGSRPDHLSLAVSHCIDIHNREKISTATGDGQR